MAVPTAGQRGKATPLRPLHPGPRCVVSRLRNFKPCHKSNVGLGCFYVLAIVKSAATNIGVQVFCKLLFPQGICTVMGLLADVVILVLIFYAE